MDNVLNEISVSYTSEIKTSNRITITSSSDSAKAFRSIFDNKTIDLHESSYILLLNSANHVIGYYRLSSGCINSTSIDPRIIFSIALKCVASSVILAHNHPSGNLKASISDIRISARLKAAGEMLEIKLLDSLIITREGFYSMNDEGDI